MDGHSTRRLVHTIHRPHPNTMPDLGLQTQAEQHFGFLVSENGYQCTQSTPYRVRFESPTTFIELVYDGDRSFELGLLVGRTGLNVNGNPPFSIDEILRLRRAPEAKKFRWFKLRPARSWLRSLNNWHKYSGPMEEILLQETSKASLSSQNNVIVTSKPTPLNAIYERLGPKLMLHGTKKTIPQWLKP